MAVKRRFPPNRSTESVRSLSRSRWAFHFLEINEMILTCLGKLKGPNIAKRALKKKNEIGGLVLPVFKTPCMAEVAQTAWGCYGDRLSGPRDGTEGLGAKSYGFTGN